MSFKLQLFGVAASILFLILIFELVRKRELKENYSLTWFSVGIGLLLLSIFGNKLDKITAILGFQQVSNAVFAYTILLLLILILGLSVAVTRLSRQSQTAIQEIALLKEKLEEKNKKT